MKSLVLIDTVTYLCQKISDDRVMIETDVRGNSISPYLLTVKRDQIISDRPTIKNNVYLRAKEFTLMYGVKEFPLTDVTNVGLGSGIYSITYSAEREGRLMLKNPIHVQDEEHLATVTRASIQTNRFIDEASTHIPWVDADSGEMLDRLDRIVKCVLNNHEDELLRLYNLWCIVFIRIRYEMSYERFRGILQHYLFYFKHDDEDYPMTENGDCLIQLPINDICSDFDGIVTSTYGCKYEDPASFSFPGLDNELYEGKLTNIPSTTIQELTKRFNTAERWCR